MNRTVLSLALLAGLGALAAPAAATDLGEAAGSKFSFEGLVQTDGYWYDNDVASLDGDPGDGSDTDFGLRRAELVLKGKGPGNFDWSAGYDASGDGKWLDVFGRYKIGGGFLQAGQYKQPNSLEELSSTRNNDFIAKALATNTFAVSRRLGVAGGYGGDDWGVTASVFGRELTRDRAHGSGYGARAYWAPVRDDGNIVHLGLSRVDYDTDADTLRLRARPGADMAQRLVDTGSMRDTDRIGTTGVEAMWVRGPFKLQGEYMTAKVDRYAGNDFEATGGYLSGVWNVTGETWGYKGGTPSTAKPANEAGMWQLGLRFDTLDLDDGAVAGGSLDTLTAGVNWYWRKNFKLALNYVKASSERGGLADDPSILEARVQLHW
jgi:phosphate-selective porin OprO/OprP